MTEVALEPDGFLGDDWPVETSGKQKRHGGREGERFGSGPVLAVARITGVVDTQCLGCNSKIGGLGSVSTVCYPNDWRRRLLPDDRAVSAMLNDRNDYHQLDRNGAAAFCYSRYKQTCGPDSTVQIHGVHVFRGAFQYYRG